MATFLIYKGVSGSYVDPKTKNSDWHSSWFSSIKSRQRHWHSPQPLPCPSFPFHYSKSCFHSTKSGLWIWECCYIDTDLGIPGTYLRVQSGTPSVCFHTNTVCCSILRTFLHQQHFMMFLTSNERSTARGRAPDGLGSCKSIPHTMHKTKYPVLPRQKHTSPLWYDSTTISPTRNGNSMQLLVRQQQPH
jgi:hypothetical protein